MPPSLSHPLEQAQTAQESENVVCISGSAARISASWRSSHARSRASRPQNTANAAAMAHGIQPNEARCVRHWHDLFGFHRYLAHDALL